MAINLFPVVFPVVRTEQLTNLAAVPRTTNYSSTWTVPAGCHKINVRMIGGGGSSAGHNSQGIAGGNTTLTYNGTTYTANAGKGGYQEAAANFISENTLSMSYDFYHTTNGSDSSSSSGGGSGNDESIFDTDSDTPGRGQPESYLGYSYTSSLTVTSLITASALNSNISSSFSSNVVVSTGGGYDGAETEFELTVTPGAVISYVIGKGAQCPRNTAKGSNPGSIYITRIS